MGSDLTPIDITWDNGSASLSKPMDAISFVFTLDLSQLTNANNVTTSIFTWSGSAEGYTIIDNGISHYYSSDWGFEENSIFASAPGNYKVGPATINNYTEAIVGYTYGKNTYCQFYLTLIDAEGNEKELGVSSGTKQRSDLTIEKLVKSDAVNNYAVYDFILSVDQMKDAMDNVSTPTVPEPTTATLSLLALAGLAARRRRR